jgi:ubiquinone/menaquinone biosynthesis C-methylase UbiE
MPPVLSHDEARAFYDRFGARQDKQAFYEDAALDRLIAHSRFEEAHAVFEFGCGTGRLAERLLERHLPGGAEYTGIDVSPTMVSLATERLTHWPARILLGDGGMTVPAADGTFDRFVATYVLDLLSEVDGRALIAEAHRTLEPGGLLCVAGITHGRGALSAPIMALWGAIAGLAPRLVGGCRPQRADRLLLEESWRIDHHSVVTAWGVASEVLVAARR